MDEQFTPKNQPTQDTNNSKNANTFIKNIAAEDKKKASPEKRKNLFLFLFVMLGAFAFLVLVSFFMQHRFEKSTNEKIQTFEDRILALQDENYQYSQELETKNAELSEKNDRITALEQDNESQEKSILALEQLLLLYDAVENRSRAEALAIADAILQDGLHEFYTGESKVLYDGLIKKLK